MAQDTRGVDLGPRILYISSIGFGVKTKTLKILKTSTNEEKIRGRNPYSQVIEETGAHLEDSGQVVGLPEIYFKTNISDVMKLISWNVCGLNAPSKHIMLKKRIT
jgi:hypothetical protein